MLKLFIEVFCSLYFFVRIVASLNRLLMSRSATIRHGARRIMEQVIQVIGIQHLPFIIKELKQIFVKGFQVNIILLASYFLVAILDSCDDFHRSLLNCFLRRRFENW